MHRESVTVSTRYIWLAGVLLAGTAGAAGSGMAAGLEECTALADDGSRLACYDRLAGRAAGPGPVAAAADMPRAGSGPAPVAAPAATVAAGPATGDTAPVRVAETVFSPRQSVSMAERWELEPQYQDGTFKFKPYAPVYLMPLNFRQRINNDPCSSNPVNCSHRGDQQYDKVGVKFQLSFKTKLWQDMLGLTPTSGPPIPRPATGRRTTRPILRRSAKPITSRNSGPPCRSAGGRKPSGCAWSTSD